MSCVLFHADIPLTPCFGHTQELPTVQQCFQVAKQKQAKEWLTLDTHLINFNPTVQLSKITELVCRRMAIQFCFL